MILCRVTFRFYQQITDMLKTFSFLPVIFELLTGGVNWFVIPV